MDTGSEYIAMCRQAKEIQDAWIPEIGDCIGGFESGATTIIINIEHGFLKLSAGGSVNNKRSVVFLPHQDQLQKMASTDYYDGLEILDQTLRRAIVGSIWEKTKSFEQLWLFIVMKRKANKIWDGKDWVKSK